MCSTVTYRETIYETRQELCDLLKLNNNELVRDSNYKFDGKPDQCLCSVDIPKTLEKLGIDSELDDMMNFKIIGIV